MTGEPERHIVGRHGRSALRSRAVAAARTASLLEGPVPFPWESLADTAGHPAIRRLFDGEDDLLDELNEHLVTEAVQRLAGIAIDASEIEHADGREAVRSVVTAIADARPVDRSSLMVRLDRRARALRRPAGGDRALAAERRFLTTLRDEVLRLLTAVGREPSIPADDLSRVLLNGYERALEAWLAAGHSEARFGSSSFIARVLPAVVFELTRPIDSARPSPSPEAPHDDPVQEHA